MLPPPTAPPPPPPTSGTTFDFVRPFAYVFEDPDWISKILIGGLFYLAMFLIIGGFFTAGYYARLVRNVIAGEPRPLPEWTDLGEYFSEGLRLTGITIVYLLPIILLVCAVAIPAGIFSAASHNDFGRQLGSGMFSCVWCLMFPLELALGLWMPAAFLMAIVDQSFGAAFDFRRIYGFIKDNFVNYLLAYLVQMVAGFAAQLGLILLCIGIIFTAFWSLCIMGYAFGQTYRLSLSRAR